MYNALIRASIRQALESRPDGTPEEVLEAAMDACRDQLYDAMIAEIERCQIDPDYVPATNIYESTLKRVVDAATPDMTVDDIRDLVLSEDSDFAVELIIDAYNRLKMNCDGV